MQLCMMQLGRIILTLKRAKAEPIESQGRRLQQQKIIRNDILLSKNTIIDFF